MLYKHNSYPLWCCRWVPCHAALEAMKPDRARFRGPTPSPMSRCLDEHFSTRAERKEQSASASRGARRHWRKPRGSRPFFAGFNGRCACSKHVRFWQTTRTASLDLHCVACAGGPRFAEHAKKIHTKPSCRPIHASAILYCLGHSISYMNSPEAQRTRLYVVQSPAQRHRRNDIEAGRLSVTPARARPTHAINALLGIIARYPSPVRMLA